ncbi:MAG: pilus assembly protein N-terminal domain-containing protein [Parvularculaceae bacterium]|nr:pilus assembly protein N-terminal domain-containing protein [Parvularculaceae bacterium]
MRKFLISLAVLFAAPAAHAEQVWLTMDQVTPYRLKQDVDQIVIGNPSIADITIQDNSRLLMFGKAPGLTNIFLFDAEGNEVDNIMVRVRSAGSEMLTVQRGVGRTTYNCMTVCEPTITVGDSTENFGAVSAQVQQKLQQAQSSANSAD